MANIVYVIEFHG